MPIKAVYADFGHTLMKPVFPPGETMITSLVDGANRAGVLEECGGETRLKQVYNEVLEKFGNVKNVAEGKLDYLLAGVYGLLNKTDYERAVICFKEEELRSLHPVEGIEVLTELLDKGIRTGIITDARYYQMLNQWLSMYNKQDNFLDIYTSAGKLDFNRNLAKKFEADKNHGKMFDILKEDMLDIGIKPAEVMIVDDRPENCSNANDRRFVTVLYTGVRESKFDYDTGKKIDFITNNMRDLPVFVKSFAEPEEEF